MKLNQAQIDRLKKLYQEHQKVAVALGEAASELRQRERHAEQLHLKFEETRGAIVAAVRETALAAGLDPDKPVQLDLDAGSIDSASLRSVEGSVATPAVVAGKRVRRH